METRIVESRMNDFDYNIEEVEKEGLYYKDDVLKTYKPYDDRKKEMKEKFRLYQREYKKKMRKDMKKKSISKTPSAEQIDLSSIKYDKRLDFANYLGFKNVTEAISKIGVKEFRKRFKDFI